MTRTRIKICGITRPKDAIAAVNAGADAIGVVLAPSPRQVSIEAAAEIAAAVGPLVSVVGVFVDAEESFVAEATRRIGLSYLQFHGSESPERCVSAPAPVIRAMRIGTEFDVDTVEPFREHVVAILLDTYNSQVAGGTGTTFNWHAVPVLPGWVSLFLAGGLNPRNVGAGIAALRPYAVDVSSGVESAPGIKDHDAIRAFCDAVRSADEGASHDC
ncbi:MAG: phosphoribosylanthranilate isomerase [Actinobacteria bacterium]|nr:phosphoribosylanthranilate isomerase [Actinomycetota bacterium]MCG2806973.1 phosphoribosylanthranilate isomerase [Coriobacteriia bacterium]